MIIVTRNNPYTYKFLQLGSAHVINTSETSLLLALMELANGYVATAAIDSIGGSPGTTLGFCVRINGVLITIGLLSGVSINWSDNSSKTKVHIKLFHLRHWNQRASVHTWHETFD